MILPSPRRFYTLTFKVKFPGSCKWLCREENCGKPRESEREFCVSHSVLPLWWDYTARGGGEGPAF